MPPKAQTLLDKIWERHLVSPETTAEPAILFVDLHLIHEVTSPQAFAELERRNLQVRHPERCLATMDHSTPTLPQLPAGGWADIDGSAANQLQTLEANCAEFKIELLGLDSPNRGIVHVVGPELGATQPGMTIVCGDSHTSTHGAFGALAFGIGSTEISHVLACQALLQRKPLSMAVNLVGSPGTGTDAKDLVLAILATIGVDGGTGHVLEFRGQSLESLSMAGRMTVCNMAIEAGARAGMIAADDTTFAYLEGRPKAPTGKLWEQSLDEWSRMRTDPDASFDKEVDVDLSDLAPMVTYGTNPGMVMPIDGRIPEASDDSSAKALDYMQLVGGEQILGNPVDLVFIGSCTNSRIEDLRAAASIMKGRRVASGLRALIVPGSEKVKRQAEDEGLDQVFTAAGAEWREPGCSMCIAMNGDRAEPGQYVMSTSNRNFVGRQGKGSRTFLASPLTAASAAIRGEVADPRELITEEVPG
ncbi:MAG: 3-isopropylmalate dehydratase large subunit [Planctomycetota bacterium]|jgi:3-isopropylmalate/(R)-2-methylmalate dehydratase large subunit